MKGILVSASILGGALLFSGCGSSESEIPEATAEMAKKYEVSQVELARGRGLYMAHCEQCHERVEPGKIDPEFWREITPHMALNARLNDKEEQELLQYVMAAHAEVHGLE
ncbi:MAG: hypothetical protein ACON38_15935 [Akkermansiaceae bacterium]